MTMHLDRGLTTLNTKKRKKKKLTESKISKLEVQMREHNKYMKKLGCPNLVMNLKEYTDYTQGNYKPKTQPVLNTPWHESAGDYKRETIADYPSVISEKTFAPCKARKPMQYSGERRLLGIATMHKSNLVPVFSDEDAKELARMRR
jgi:hypothetical protein